jgi:hypothetical protein
VGQESFDTYRAAEIARDGWTVLTAMTGYAAWALGGLVGFGMAHTTVRRDSVAAGSAATLALIGLLIARVLIGEFVMGGALDEVLTDDELMAQAATLDLQFNEGFSK